MEEAGIIANEYVASLDNLPNEVQFLLKEIKAKDVQAFELQNKISVRTAGVTKSRDNGPIQVNKDLTAWGKSRHEFDTLDRLAEEKVVLAQRLLQLMTKCCGRLDYDLARVRVASGDVPLSDTSFSVVNRSSAVDKVVSSLRSAVGTPEPSTSSQGGTGTGLQKKRRLNSSVAGSVNNAPVTLTHVPNARSRLSNHAQARPSPAPRRGRASAPLDEDFEMDEEDGDADDGGEDNGDQDDQEYCFCRKMSYGEMIACDNPDCPYEWFHLGCVGIKPPVPQTWYCSECVRTLGLSGDDGGTEKVRKGRRR